jgi:serine protease Do
MSWAVFVLHSDGTVLARYGSMANRDNPERDITIDGFRRALEGALDLHAKYPANRQALAGKQGRPTDFATPEQYPSLRDYAEQNERTADPVRGCIHCHQLREAQRLVFRDAGLPLPDNLMYPFPMPDALGLSLDPQQRARVVAVAADSPAASAGLKPGDDIVALAGQPVVSIADVQWALHTADGATDAAADESIVLPVVVRREKRPVRLTLALPAHWRAGTDISWRATTWDLRRMATGGLVLEELTPDERAQRGLPADGLALRVKYVGQYGQHAAGRDAGFREDDVIVSFGGHAEPLSESALIALALEGHRPGERVAVTVARGNERVELMLPQQ